jgi:hypothetical protein
MGEIAPLRDAFDAPPLIDDVLQRNDFVFACENQEPGNLACFLLRRALNHFIDEEPIANGAHRGRLDLFENEPRRFDDVLGPMGLTARASLFSTCGI